MVIKYYKVRNYGTDMLYLSDKAVSFAWFKLTGHKVISITNMQNITNLFEVLGILEKPVFKEVIKND